MKFEKWQIPTVSAEAVRRLTEAGYPYLVSAVLVSRGIMTAADAAAFLAQEHSLIYDPRLMRDHGPRRSGASAAPSPTGSAWPCSAITMWTASPRR